MAESDHSRHTLPRKRPVFAAQSARAETSRFGPEERSQIDSEQQQSSGAQALFTGLFRRRNTVSSNDLEAGGDRQRRPSVVVLRRASLSTNQIPHQLDYHDKKEKGDKHHGQPDVSEKLGTFSGVFVPTTLNVLSILMFLRFGFILGQSGFLGIMGMLIASYLINLITTMSISAIATNGTVRGGGAYYLISRSLGPEFGGSIGVICYLGFVFNTGMNAVGLIDCFTQSFGSLTGTWANFLPEGFWWAYLWGTIVLVLCTAICLAGSSMFSRASNGLLLILLIATFSIPLSAFVMGPFSKPSLGVEVTGLSAKTFLDNLKPRLTKGAAGSQIRGRENFQDLFGILFPATGGIFAGASMSGDLRNPSKSIPKGTISGLGLTFLTYFVVILAMAASITRKSLYADVNIIQDVNISGILILLGEFATSFFSSLMGVIGSAKLLQAIARDTILPGLSIFGQGTAKTDEPTNAIIFTFVVAQLTMLFDINRIASFITMTYLMTFLVTNLACFLLKIGSAPNFRPSFHYFNSWTALAGTLISGATMFFVDGVYASGSVCILFILFLLIHYTTPPKPWGDVSQSLIYHQVRKYLLRLKPEHVKFWRPQILLFVNDYDTQYKMIHFCNSLKKGALFVLGHVIVTEDFAGAVPEVRREQASWTKFIEFSKVKAFVNISASPTAEWGVRNIVLNSGLGGMRPNIVVIDQFRKDQPIAEMPQELRRRRASKVSRSFGSDSSDRNGNQGEAAGISSKNSTMGVKSYLTILEDLLFKLRINVAVAKGFEDLELPAGGRNNKRFIDLWPIQMSAELAADSTTGKQNLLTTNFDTYTLILQLGCILHTVPSWKKSYLLRVAVFVEYESDVEEERGRVETLLEKLRIEAEVLVFWLACGSLKSYRIIVNGESSGLPQRTLDSVEEVLRDEDWWQDMQKFRKGSQSKAKLSQAAKLLSSAPSWPTSSFQDGRHKDNGQRFDGLRKLIQSSKRRKSVGSIGSMGVNLGMQTHRLLDSVVEYHAENDDDDDESSDEDDVEEYYSDGSDGVENSETPTPSEPRKAKQWKADHLISESAIADDSDTSDPSPSRSSGKGPTITTTDEGGDSEPIPAPAPKRPQLSRAASSNKFSSSPIPETKVASEEGAGPSLMFAPIPSPPKSTAHESIYVRRQDPAGPSSSDAAPPSGETSEAPGYASQASAPLSFNDLPCRAQHLILNELMRSHSQNTAVLFTTLPSPIEGTWRDEEASQSYVSDLEVLCDGLPPCLLVHSNSMTVTMNL